MSVQTEIDRISTAVQNAHLKVIEKGGTSAAPYLVANLESAIDTIPTGEDVTAETTEYTDLLTDLEVAVDALPDAGSGGSVETCSVRIINNDKSIYGYSYLAYRDGQFVPVLFNNYISQNNLDVTLPDVICGGCVYIQTRVMIGMMEMQVVGEATTSAENIVGSGYAVVMVYAPNTAGSESTVTIIDND